jgi:carboxymethylenebutenolidase
MCPIVASYGGREKVVARHAERLRGHLGKLPVARDVTVYDDAGHGFITQGSHPIGKLVLLPMRIGYEPDAAGDAWRRAFAFFDERLKAAEKDPESPFPL